MAVYLVIVYAVSRPFGAAAQAGFGVGQRIIQALFMPAVALVSRWRRSLDRTWAPARQIASTRPFARRSSSSAAS